MKTYKVIGIASLIVVFGVLGVLWQKPWNAIGSVTAGNEYNATSTVGMSDLNSGHFITTGSQTILGSVVVASSSPTGILRIKDATSTTDIASTTVTTFATSTVAGTYTFDVALKRGLVLEGSSNSTFNGDFVVTWRK